MYVGPGVDFLGLPGASSGLLGLWQPASAGQWDGLPVAMVRGKWNG
jgi:hypothetical protein